MHTIPMVESFEEQPEPISSQTDAPIETTQVECLPLEASQDEVPKEPELSEALQPEGGTTPSSPAGAADRALVPLAVHEELIQAKEELLDLLLRRQAEFENLRRRTEREKSEFFDFALSNFVLELLPILDGFDRGLNSPGGESVDNYKTGMELLSKQFHAVLESVGLKRIAAQGANFDPNLHYAVMMEETAEVPDGQVLQEFQPGYLFKDKLLRPTMAKVAIQPADSPPNSMENDEGREPEC